MNKILLSFFLLLVFAASAWAGDAKESAYDRVMRTGTIRCGYFIWPPGFSIDPNVGKRSGFFTILSKNWGKD